MTHCPIDYRPYRSIFNWLAAVVVAATMASLVGCGGDSGPKRYDLSGTVTYDGKPVPAGTIIFEPDSSKGNPGPQGVAEIRDGKYDTSKNGKGLIGGPHIVRITGFDRATEDETTTAEPLFSEYKIEVDLPKEGGTKDFEVPADAPKPPKREVSDKGA